MKIYKYFIMLAMGLTTPLLTSCDELLGEVDNPAVEISSIKIKANGLANGEVTMTVGTTLQLSAEIYPAAAAKLDVVWTSGDASVVNVSPKGLVTAAKVGSVKVKVASKANSKISASVTIRVVDHISAITIKGDGITDGETTVTVGTDIQLAAELTPANTLEKEIEWQTEDATLATVSNAGLVKTLKAGDVKIKAVSKVNSNVNATVIVHILDHIKTLTITGDGIVDDKIALKIGATLQLAAVLNPENTLETGTEWTTDNAEVASVTTEGLITAVKTGEATIKLASTVNSQVYATLKVTVVDDIIDNGNTPVDPGNAESRRM